MMGLRSGQVEWRLAGRFLLLTALVWPIPLQAAGVVFDSPLTVTNGYDILDQSTNLFDYGQPIRTKLDIDFTGTTGIWLEMDADWTTVYEQFAFTMTNSTGATIDKISFAFIKPEGATFNQDQIPDPFFWALAISDSWGSVRVGGMSLVEADNAVNVELPFLPSYRWQPGNDIRFDLTWYEFNAPRADWLLNIDLNEIDNNDPRIPDIEPVVTPIPGAVWLFGTSLFGLLMAARRRHNA